MPYAHEVRFLAVPMVVLLTWRQLMGTKKAVRANIL